MADENYKRKLTAILSADVAGYSRLMGDDEVATVITLKSYRNLISEKVQDFHGRVVDSPGDKVLLMDDEQIIRAVGSEMLELLGYEVVCARDGTEAVELYRQAQEKGHAFDAVILDLTIPGGMGGKDAVSKILSLDPTAAVIVSSGYSNDPVVAEYRHYGFRGAVCKPYRLQELSAILHEVLDVTRDG